MKTLLCCCAKNENLYIREWVEHYRRIGFTHIIIYDNNDPDGERLEESIGDYIDDGFVSVEDRRGAKVIQPKCYDTCFKKYGKQYDWVAFFDCDEFLVVNGGLTIEQYLSEAVFEPFQMIHVNWKLYDDNDLLRYDPRPVRERFTRELPYGGDEEFHANFHVKTIVRGGADITWKNCSPHTPRRKNDRARCCNASGKEVDPDSPFSPYDFSRACLNHYAFKSIEEFAGNKLQRGFPDQIVKDKAKKTARLFFQANRWTPEKQEIADRVVGSAFPLMPLGKMNLLAVAFVKTTDVALLEKSILSYIEDVEHLVICGHGAYGQVLGDNFYPDKITYLETDEGCGTASAFNLAAGWGKCHGYSHILFMDHGSIWKDFKSFRKMAEPVSDPYFGMIKAKYTYRGSPFSPLDSGVTIPAGILMPVFMLSISGGFREDFKLDCIDKEMELKVVDAGYNIVTLREELAVNHLDIEEKGKFVLYNLSPERLYSISRNNLLMWRTFRNSGLPEYSAGYLIFFFKRQVMLAKNVLLFENRKAAKIWAICLGFAAGFLGKKRRGK